MPARSTSHDGPAPGGVSKDVSENTPVGGAPFLRDRPHQILNAVQRHAQPLPEPIVTREWKNAKK